MTAIDTQQPNRFAGPCSFCGSRVQAGAGTYSRPEGVRHREGECKTTTKTYRDSVRRQQFTEFQAAFKAVYADAGYDRWPSHRVEYADEIRGHGLLALVGGYKRGEVMRDGVRVYRVLTRGAVTSDLVHECPIPQFLTDDFYADSLAQARALVAILDGLR
jgi:hypothetical protein